jgi:Zn-dependent protease with chaperone function
VLAASVLLAVFALALAWPVPVVLARSRWQWRAPATALVLWQAIALAGGVSMIGSLVAFGLVPFGDDVPTSVAGLFRAVTAGTPVSGTDVLHLASLCGGALLGVHLVLNLVLTVVISERQRRRHGHLVQLLSSPVPDQPNTRLIDHSVPVAYCLPGTSHSVTVFSAGLVTLLAPRELAAVIEHEKAHLLQRHYIVLMAFGAWRSSLPWFPIATRAHREVSLLVEMLADDFARREVDDRTLATAIALVSTQTPQSLPQDPYDSWAPAAETQQQLSSRVARLLDGSPRLSKAGRAVVGAAALVLVAVPTVLLVLPSVTAA